MMYPCLVIECEANGEEQQAGGDLCCEGNTHGDLPAVCMLVSGS